MADFLDSEAEESEDEEELDAHDRKKSKKAKAVPDSSEEDDEDDEERLREELKDLIDDNPIEEGSENEDTDGSGASKKRKKHDDDELDDRLEDDDYDLIEENLGVKVERRKRFKRLRRIQDNESDNEEAQHVDEGLAREAIAEQLFDENNDESVEHRSDRSNREVETYEDDDSESDADDFIVDDNGRPIGEKKKKRRAIFTDASLQEGQDIFGVDFDYDDFSKYEEDEYDDDSDAEEYDEDAGEEGAERKIKKKTIKKKVAKKTIFDVYEPSELKRGHFTDLDNEIRKTDIPERMQLRQIPVTPVLEGSNELDAESEWIYKHAFCKPTVSQQDQNDTRDKHKKPPSTVLRIKQTLEFIRNQQLEVPFIAFYRKEYVKPELNIDDLWKVYYFDERWCQLRSRKEKLNVLFEKMRNYQLNELCKDTSKPLPDDIRLIKESDFDRLREVQSMAELKDVHSHFLLHYSHEIPKMHEDFRQKERERRRQVLRAQQLKNAAADADNPDAIDNADHIEIDDDESEPEEVLKQAKDTGPYATCRKAGICGFANRFGLPPEKFAENLRDSYQRNEVDQEQLSPTELAKQYLSPRFMTVDEVIHAVKFVVAQQLSREPLLRKTMREVFFERAKLNVKATRRGLVEIDENHPCYSMKYLAKKPVNGLFDDQFLKLLMAEDQKLIEITFCDDIDGNAGSNSSYVDEAKQLYHLDQFSKNVQEWNTLRAECVELAFKKMLIPDLFKELRAVLTDESKEGVLRSCTTRLHQWLKVSPYKPSFTDDSDYDDWSTVRGIRSMGLAYEPDIKSAAFCAITTADGDISDYLRLPHLLKRKNSNRNEDKAAKLSDLRKLKELIRNKKPHVIAIGGESREAQMIQNDIQDIVKELIDEEQYPEIDVEIIDNELAKIYANSKKGNSDFKEYPILLKQAVSLARKMQDPLVEYSQLCNADDEILCLRFHTLQEQLSRDLLLEQLYLQFINRTNDVGLDINLAVLNSRTINLIQFICGLGPRKGQALLKILKQSNQRLENRTQLVTLCHLGPKVFINCSGFIKIDTSSLGDSTEAYVEVLDGSRVHPETYEWARKMAIDAMEYDDEETNPAGALEEILDSPERLKDLDLDAFAVELERQGFGSKSITLYDIRNELSCLYKDFRSTYRAPNSEELFDMLTKESPETFYVGKCIQAEVIGISHRRPQGDQLDQANPVRMESTNMWQCPFCHKDDFPELSDVWNHFDENSCPGQPVGVKIRLENGLLGFIHMKNFSDKPVKKLEERVRFGQTIHVRIIKIDVDRFSVDCTSKTTDLHDVNNEYRPRRDQYYDYGQEKRDERKYTDQKKKIALKAQCKRRVIAHPNFHNVTYMEAIDMMKTMDQGEVIMRPSTKGYDHITGTWKVTDNIYQHIDVREEGNENDFSIGRSLWIGNEEFEDLDEIIARFINPMAQWTRELLNYKYYRDTLGGMKDKMEELLKEEKAKDSKKIHYFLSASKNYPGKFLLSYLPKAKCRHEYVTVIPEGYRFRGLVHVSINNLLKWFKEHYSDPIQTPSISTPHGSVGQSSMRAPAHYGSSSQSGGMGYTSSGSIGGGSSVRSSSSNMDIRGSSAGSHYSQYHTTHSSSALSLPMSQYVVNTPAYSASGGSIGGGGSISNSGSYVTTPYTPSGQTPFMTPYNATPHSNQTPRYSHNVPSPSSSSSSNLHFRHPGYTTGGVGGSSSSTSNLLGNNYKTSPALRSYYDSVGGTGSGGIGGSGSSSHSHTHTLMNPNAYTTGTSTASSSSHRNKESLEWQLAADSWARRKPQQPQQYHNQPQNLYTSTQAAASAAAAAAAAASTTAKPSPMINDFTNTSRLLNNYTTTTTPTNDYHTAAGSASISGSAGIGGLGSSLTLSAAMSQYNTLTEDRLRGRDYAKSARSTPRSTPRTNTSPRSMNLGDSTPLYDEN